MLNFHKISSYIYDINISPFYSFFNIIGLIVVLSIVVVVFIIIPSPLRV